uniref:Transmembrane protein fend n=2 Tax=Tephritidae TaxID=7211 RepID=W8B071_CERCA
MFTKKKINATLIMAFAVTTLLGFLNAEAVSSKDLFRCRQSCYRKFVKDWHHCMDFEDCKNMCITPPNINSYIPEAFSFLCWNNCDQQLGPFPLNINSALRQGSLVLTNIAWDQAITNASKQCLVTWEVSGGGLMGNLLTDSSTVELSLWPDTVYHVQVTCKHKETGGMRRSYKLIVDTHKLSDSTVTGMQAITLETGNMASKEGMMPHLYGSASAMDIGANSGEADSRMRILKDSSKDFLSPYNPDNELAKKSNSDSSTSSSSSSTVTTTITTSTSSTTSSTQRSAEEKPEEEEAVELSNVDDNAVQRVHLVEEPSLKAWIAYEFKKYAMVLVGIGMMLYMYMRPKFLKDIPDDEEEEVKTDRQVLIHEEMLPSQTPQALGISPATAALEVTILPVKKCNSAAAAAAASAQGNGAAAACSQTLHV